MVIIKKENGFTLVEMLTAMAVYSILLVIVAFSLVTFSKLNDVVIKNDEHDEAIIMENFIVKLWKQNNQNILFNEDTLFEFDDHKLTFFEGSLYYDDQIVAGHKKITNLERNINGNTVIFKFTINETIKPIVLLYLGGDD